MSAYGVSGGGGSGGGVSGGGQKRWEDLTPEEREAATKWWQNYAYMSALSAAAAATSSTTTTTVSKATKATNKTVSSSSSLSSAPSRSTPSAAPSTGKTPVPSGAAGSDDKKSKFVMAAAGITWVDSSLEEWPENDFRLFVGDLGNDCTDAMLAEAFQRYESFQKARVVKDRSNGYSRGYGFVSFSDPADYTRALREMNGKYCGSRPMKLKRSRWKDKLATAENLARRKDAALPPALPRRMDVTSKGARRTWL